MPLPVSGGISFSQLRRFLKQTTTGAVSLSQLRAGAGFVPASSRGVTGGGSGTAAIPSAGATSFSNFYGAMYPALQTYATAGTYSFSRSTNRQSAYLQTVSLMVVGSGGGGGNASATSGVPGEVWTAAGGGGGAGGVGSLISASSAGHLDTYTVRIGPGSNVAGEDSWIVYNTGQQITGFGGYVGVNALGYSPQAGAGGASGAGFAGGAGSTAGIDVAAGGGGGGAGAAGQAADVNAYGAGAGGSGVSTLVAGVTFGTGGRGGDYVPSQNGAPGTDGLGNGGEGATYSAFSSGIRYGGTGGDGGAQISYWRTFEDPFV